MKNRLLFYLLLIIGMCVLVFSHKLLSLFFSSSTSTLIILILFGLYIGYGLFFYFFEDVVKKHWLIWLKENSIRIIVIFSLILLIYFLCKI